MSVSTLYDDVRSSVYEPESEWDDYEPAASDSMLATSDPYADCGEMDVSEVAAEDDGGVPDAADAGASPALAKGDFATIRSGEFRGRRGQVLALDGDDATVLVDGAEVTVLSMAELRPEGQPQGGQTAPDTSTVQDGLVGEVAAEVVDIEVEDEAGTAVAAVGNEDGICEAPPEQSSEAVPGSAAAREPPASAQQRQLPQTDAHSNASKDPSVPGSPSADAEAPNPDEDALANDGGYVFLCSPKTLFNCQAMKVFGSPDWEMNQMKRCITPGTQLFLFNIDDFVLRGPFVSNGTPDRALVPGAFGGRFNAQVKVKLLDEVPLREAQLDQRMMTGPKSASEVKDLRERLNQGRALKPEALARWKAPPQECDDTGPPQKGGKGRGCGWQKGGPANGAGRPWDEEADGRREGLKRPWSWGGNSSKGGSGKDNGQAGDWDGGKAGGKSGWKGGGKGNWKRQRYDDWDPHAGLTLQQAIRRQIEYYLCDKNLRTDDFFRSKILETPEGWVDVSCMLGCKRIQDMGVTEDADIEAALAESHLETRRQPAGTGTLQIRRAEPLPPVAESKPSGWLAADVGDKRRKVMPTPKMPTPKIPPMVPPVVPTVARTVAPAGARVEAPAVAYAVGEEVQVLSGEFQGQTGEILSIDDNDITVFVGGMDVAVLSSADLAHTGKPSAAKPATDDRAAEIEKFRKDLEAKREELRRIVTSPEHIARFLNAGRLLHMRDGDKDWGWGILVAATNQKPAQDWVLEVFLLCEAGSLEAQRPRPPTSAESSRGQVLSMGLDFIQQVSKVRAKMPTGDPRSERSLTTLGKALETIKAHPSFKKGLPELDPVQEMTISTPDITALLAAIADIEKRLGSDSSGGQ